MKSPLDPAHAALAIEDASDRQQVFDALLRAARSKLRFAALLSVHPDHIRGRSAIAEDGFDIGGIDTLRIPRNTVSALETAIASGSPSIGPLATGEPFIDGYLEMLGGPATSSLLLPITIKDRTVALVAAHGGDRSPSAADVDQLTPLLELSSQALARVLATREKAAGSTTITKRIDTDGYEMEVSIADVSTKRTQLDKFRYAGQWAEVAEGIRELIRDGMELGEPDEDEQLELLLELGRIEGEQLGNPERALEAWRSAQTIDAGETRILDAMEAFYVQQGRWEECIDLVERRVALCDTDGSRIALLLNLATLAHEKLGDDDRAVAAYQRILELDPAHDFASRELGKLYTAHEQWQPLSELLLDRASRTDDLEPLILVAHIFEDKLSDPHNAFVVWLTVFRREPSRAHLLDQLSRLAARVDLGSELIADTKALAEEIEPKHPHVAAEIWQMVGKWLRDRMDNRDEAAHAFDRAARINPDKTDEAAELLRNDARWPELIALLVRHADQDQNPQQRAALYGEIAEVYETKLEQPFDAIEWYERAEVEDPTAQFPLVALHRLYLERENWEALGELLPKLIETLGLAAPRPVIVDLYVELGTILADHLGRPEDAVESFRDALALDPKHVPAFQGLAKIYSAGGQTEALLEASEAEVDASSPVEQVRRYADIAAAWHELSRLDRATATWRKLIALDPRNVHAHKGLARALRDDEQWAELALSLRAQLRVTTEPFERVALLLELADLLERHFDNVDGATSAYREVLSVDAQNRAALDALSRLYDRAGNWQAALDILQKLSAQTVNDRREHSDMLQRIGQVHLSARDTVKAEASLAEAIALDPENAHAHEGMGRVLLQQGKLVAAAEKLLRAAQLCQQQSETLRLLTDAAWIYRYRLADNEHAKTCLQRILDLDPEHADAKQAMAELLHESEEWATLWPHLEEQAKRAKTDESLPAADRLAILSKAARCALELSKFKTAIELYDVASAIDPTPATQVDRAEALYRSNSLDAAAMAYQTVVARHQSTLDRTQLISIYRRLGAIHAELGKVQQAVTFYQKVLDLDGKHRETLQDLAELHLSRGQFDEAIATLRSLAANAAPLDRIALLERIGDLYRDKLAAPPRAMSTYLEALELDKTNHRILHRILELQSDTGQWKAATETIERFLELETDRARRGAYYIASAEIRRTHLKDEVGALDYYETAIDEMFREDPLRQATRERALDAFHALRELVTTDRDWKYLEQSYRRMIKRLPKGDPVQLPLWDGLGEIYRTKLAHPQSAIEAFEVAHAMDADKSSYRARVLAELYAQAGVKRPKQATEKARVVEIDPMSASGYRTLGRTAHESGRVDEAWCVARALVFLKQANKEETALYHRFQRNETRKAKGLLDEDAWSNVRHSDEDLTISAIFALTWEASVALRAGPTKAFNLKAKERLAIEESTGVVAKIFKHASRVLQVALPDVYVQPRRPGRLLLANCVEKGRLAPAVIVGRDLMTGYRDTEIAASVGSMIALLRPSYYLKLTLGTVDELEAALAAASQIVGKPRATRPQLAPMVEAIAAELPKHLTRATGEALLQLVHRLPEQPDLATWRNAVDATAQRAGLIISGDLAATARMITSEAVGPGAQRANQRVQELVAYSVSPAYFEVRRHLGINVE